MHYGDWNTFGDAMTKIADLGDDTYGYIAGQGSSHIVECNLWPLQMQERKWLNPN